MPQNQTKPNQTKPGQTKQLLPLKKIMELPQRMFTLSFVLILQ